jgi:predicted ATP-grasp superfamily ATP-dependent carboligase
MHQIIWVDREGLVRSKLADKPLYVALPDTGLISLITATHIVQSLKADLLGFLDADWIPPVTVITKAIPCLQ